MSLNFSSESDSTSTHASSADVGRLVTTVDSCLDRRSENRSNALGLPEATPDVAVSARVNLSWLFIALVAVGVVVLGGLMMAVSVSPKNTNAPLTHTVALSDLDITVTEKGTLESSNNTEIKCKVRGYSKVTWVVDVGSIVKPGDVLVRLDTKQIEDEIGRHTTSTHEARAVYERTKADVASAEIAIDAYLKGSYRAQLKDLEKQKEAAEAALENAEKTLVHSENMFRKGYLNKFEMQANRLSLMQAELELKVRKNAIEVLNKYTKEMELETLRGNLRALRSKMKADEAGLAMDEGRRDRAIEELTFCEIKAERDGLVIYPSAAAWKSSPDVVEGATVRKDQVLLLMPDLSKMQIKIGIHESLIDRVKEGQPAKITLPDLDFEGKVTSVARVARPAGWWNANVVNYDTVIELPEMPGLKPGMTASVEVVMAKYQDVLTVPVSAVIETEAENLCWVKTKEGFVRRSIELGDSNDVFIIVESGLAAGDEVVLNPLKTIEDAQDIVQLTLDDQSQSTIGETSSESNLQTNSGDDR